MCLNLLSLTKIHGNRREVSGGDMKYIPSGTNMFYELVSHEALGNLIHMNAFTNYVYLVRAQEQITYFSLQGICEWVYSCRFSLSYKKYISKALDFTRSLQKQVELYGISCQGLEVDEIHVALLFNMM